MTATPQEMKDIEAATIAQKLLPQGTALLDNVNALDGCRHVSDMRGILEGLPVLVCGAGPSLDADVDALRKVAAGRVVVAVSTALTSLKALGIRVDVVTTMESVDTARPMVEAKGWAKSAWLDIAANPAAWAACDDIPRVVYHGRSIEAWALTFSLGAMPIDHAGSVTTAAISTAIAMGATDIALVGCNFAYADDGSVYAANSGWGDEKIVPDGGEPDEKGHEWLTFENRETWKLDAVEKATGVRPLEHRSFKWIDGWDGEPRVRSTMDYITQQMWCAKLRTWHPHHRLLNCSVGGAKIKGFQHRPLSAITNEEIGIAPSDIYAERLLATSLIGEFRAGAVRRYIRDSTEQAREVAQCIMMGTPTNNLPWLHDPGPVEIFCGEQKVMMAFAQKRGQKIPPRVSIASRRSDVIRGVGMVYEAMGEEVPGE